MIPVYNCASVLPETLQSVLMQDPGPAVMQIQVVDDGSTDANVAALVNSVGKGRVQYVRQPANVGSLKNFETCINNAMGHLVHILHGDDRVIEGYYAKMDELFNRFPSAGAAFCRYENIDENGNTLWPHTFEAQEDGILDDWFMKIASSQRLQFCTISVKRGVYEKLGGFYGVTYGEDWEMWARIAHSYPVAYTPQMLAQYRKHTNSISARSFATAKNVRDIRWVIDTIQQMVPEEKRAMVKKVAYKHYARHILNIANTVWYHTRNKKTTILQLKEGLRMHTDATMLIESAKILIKVMLNHGSNRQVK
jgi:glycosyltransferase involved in cell wall biosynthesis